MKNILLLFALTPFLAWNQLQVSITIRTTDGNTLNGVSTNITSDNKVQQTKETDASGKVSYEVTTPGIYTFYYKDGIEGFQFEMKEGRRGQMSRTITYDPEGVFVQPEKRNREGITFKEINQKGMDFSPSTGKCTYQVVLKNLQGQPASGIRVDMVDFNLNLKFRSVTDSRGMAKFFLNTGQSYEIDVNGVEAVDFVEVPRVKYGTFTSELPFEKAEVTERIKEDTIIQSNIKQTDGATTHAYCRIELVDYNREGLANEKVYLNDRYSDAVYLARTDDKGVAEFMLKNGTHYILHLTMERDCRLIKLDQTRGFAKVGLTHSYRGTNNIREMLANRKRDDKGFIQKFVETPIRKLDDGEFDIKIKAMNSLTEITTKESGKVPSLTMAEGKVYFSEGFYSPKFYAYDPNKKEIVWSVKLGESGAGAAVYDDGVLLINTYSCTLYALEASTGKLLWSKYLANTLYSNPSVKDGQVVVVYDNEIIMGKTNRYVLANFDLKTGKINWQQHLSQDAIACPVVEGNEVHVTSVNGYYKIFDLKKGEVKTFNSSQAISSPTITKDEIILAVKRGGKEGLATFDRKSLERKAFVTIEDSSNVNIKAMECFERMHYQGLRAVRYKGMNYIISGSKLVCVDTEAETVVWKQEVGFNGKLRAVAAVNGRVFVQTDRDAIYFYDAETGRQENVINTHCAVYAPFTSVNRKLGYADDAGHIYIQNINVDMKIPQWGLNGTHNLIYKD